MGPVEVSQDSASSDPLKQLRQLIVERARRPRHGGVLEPADAAATAENPSCGDRVVLTIRLNSARQQLAAVRCAIRGCVLCSASGDLMAELIHGRTPEQALELGKGFVALLKDGPCGATADPALDLLRPLAGLPARARCALLPWRALAEALGRIQDGNQKVANQKVANQKDGLPSG